MKLLPYITALVFFFTTTTATAQNNMEDVLYLKNGNVYRGVLIEQVPNQSYKIQIAGGSIFTVTVAEVEKITKEQSLPSASTTATSSEDRYADFQPFMHSYRDTSKAPYYLKKRRFFTQLEFRPGVNNVGLRLVHGYKFGRFGFVGIGIGLDAVSFSNRLSNGSGIFNNTDPNNGIYLPLYIHYSGEILRKRITPYYYIEAGYAGHPNNPFTESNGNKSYGGPIAAAGFGVKFYSKGRASFALNLNANFRSNRYRTVYNATDAFGNPYTYTQRGTAGKAFGAIGLSIGF